MIFHIFVTVFFFGFAILLGILGVMTRTSRLDKRHQVPRINAMS